MISQNSLRLSSKCWEGEDGRLPKACWLTSLIQVSESTEKGPASLNEVASDRGRHPTDLWPPHTRMCKDTNTTRYRCITHTHIHTYSVLWKTLTGRHTTSVHSGLFGVEAVAKHWLHSQPGRASQTIMHARP